MGSRGEGRGVAKTVEDKTELKIIKTVSNTAITEYIGLGVDKMSVIKKGETMIMLKDQTRIVVPQAMRRTLLERESIWHTAVSQR